MPSNCKLKFISCKLFANISCALTVNRNVWALSLAPWDTDVSCRNCELFCTVLVKSGVVPSVIVVVHDLDLVWQEKSIRHTLDPH